MKPSVRNPSAPQDSFAPRRPSARLAASALVLALAAAPAVGRQQAVDTAACLDAPIDKLVEVCSRIPGIGKIEGYLLATIHLSRGVARQSRGEHDAALEELDTAMRIDPNRAEVYRHRGISFFSKGDYDRAIENFDASLGLAPSVADTVNDRGVVYLKKRQFQRALDDFDHALLLNPAHVEAAKNRQLAIAGLADATNGRAHDRGARGRAK